MVSMSSSKVSVDYATRIERLNNLPNFFIMKEPINSSQLSYEAIEGKIIKSVRQLTLALPRSNNMSLIRTQP